MISAENNCCFVGFANDCIYDNDESDDELEIIMIWRLDNGKLVQELEGQWSIFSNLRFVIFRKC